MPLTVTVDQLSAANAASVFSRDAYTSGTLGAEVIPAIVTSADLAVGGIAVDNGTRLSVIALLQALASPIIHTVGDLGEPPFQNSWVAFGSTFAPPRFYKDATGCVVLEGLAKSGTLNAAMFTLPVGYRPGVNEHIYQIVQSNSVAAVVEVQSSGVVLVNGSSTNFSLWGIRFRPAL